MYHRPVFDPRTWSRPIEHSNHYRLGSLGDLVELLVDGWHIEHLHYADRCGITGTEDVPGAFVGLTRSDQHEHIYLIDDGRSMSHRSLVGLFREHPNVWKHRSIPGLDELSVPESAPQVPEQWGTVPEPFPQAVRMSPGTLRGVVCINQTQSIDGVTVAITSLERYADGARVHYLCHLPGGQQPDQAGAMDAIAVDDAARMYRVAAVDTRHDGELTAGSLVLGPAVPHDTGTLTITIGTLGPGPAGQGLPGPWVFPIHLDAQP